jgi:hypothetical protein
MLNKKTLSFTAGVLLLSGSVPAAAQTSGSARPFRGALFGSHGDEKSTQRLDVSGLVLEAYDDNLFATLGSSVDPRSRQMDGFYTLLQPGIDYRFTQQRVQVGVTGMSALGYYPDFRELKSISHNLGAGVSMQPGRKTTILVNQTAAYSPSYLYGLFPTSPETVPGQPMPDAPNYSVNNLESFSYGTTSSVSFSLSRRATASFGGNYRYTDFTHETIVQRDQVSKGGDGQFSYQRTRNFAFRLSYHYLTGNLGYGGADADTAENRLEAGVSYSRPLSASRHMSFTFNAGSSAVDTTGGPEFQLPDRLYRASADASLDYPFARSWAARGSFRRGLEFVPGLAQPVYANGVTAGLDGLLSRRLEIGFAGGYSQGRSALAPAASQFDTYNGSVRLQYALANSTAIHVEYLYYFYDFLGDALVLSGAPPRLERNGVRVGLRFFVPTLKD